MNSTSAGAATSSRVAWVDVAKGIGIAIVFYGHFVERFIPDVPAAQLQMKWIYSFHMPMFFVFSGFVYKDRNISFDGFLKRQLLTRLVPVWIFTLVGMPLWVLARYAPGESNWLALAYQCATETLSETLRGRPTKNILMWFLVCLFMVELWQFGLRSLVRKRGYLVLSILCFGLLTVVMSTYRERITLEVGTRIDWWHITSAVAAMVFYQVGILLRRLGLFGGNRPTVSSSLLGIVCLAVTLLTFNLNHILGYPTVRLVDAAYGNMAWFFLGSFCGAFFLVCSAQVLAASRVLNYVGRITLALMCLNGIMQEYVNPAIAKWIMRLFPEPNAPLLTGICLLGTVLSIAICIPITWALNRYVPFVFGRRMSGPASAG